MTNNDEFLAYKLFCKKLISDLTVDEFRSLMLSILEQQQNILYEIKIGVRKWTYIKLLMSIA